MTQHLYKNLKAVSDQNIRLDRGSREHNAPGWDCTWHLQGTFQWLDCSESGEGGRKQTPAVGAGQGFGLYFEGSGEPLRALRRGVIRSDLHSSGSPLAAVLRLRRPEQRQDFC